MCNFLQLRMTRYRFPGRTCKNSSTRKRVKGFWSVTEEAVEAEQIYRNLVAWKNLVGSSDDEVRIDHWACFDLLECFSCLCRTFMGLPVKKSSLLGLLPLSKPTHLSWKVVDCWESLERKKTMVKSKLYYFDILLIDISRSQSINKRV